MEMLKIAGGAAVAAALLVLGIYLNTGVRTPNTAIAVGGIVDGTR